MIERLNETLDEIEQRLTDTIEVTALARIAAMSEYHYRRMFAALAGIPLSEYIRRRRLTVASAEVLAGRRTLLEIAVTYGYGSADTFARAFRAMHGVSPGEARATGAALRSQPRMRFRLTIEGSTLMQYRIVEKPAFTVAGRKARVPLIYLGENTAIAEFIRSIDNETSERIDALSDQEPRGVVSVCDNFSEEREEGSELDYYLAAVTGAEPPADLDTLAVPAGMWVVFQSEDTSVEAAQNLWRDAYQEWFPANPYQMRPGPEILSMGCAAELWLPVEPMRG